MRDEKKLMEKYDKLNRRMLRYFSSFFTGTQITSIQGLILHYIIIESEARDRRYKKLVLTEQTLAIKDDITSRVNEYMHSMFAGISEDDLEVFEKVILQMTENTK